MGFFDEVDVASIQQSKQAARQAAIKKTIETEDFNNYVNKRIAIFNNMFKSYYIKYITGFRDFAVSKNVPYQLYKGYSGKFYGWLVDRDLYVSFDNTIYRFKKENAYDIGYGRHERHYYIKQSLSSLYDYLVHGAGLDNSAIYDEKTQSIAISPSTVMYGHITDNLQRISFPLEMSDVEYCNKIMEYLEFEFRLMTECHVI